MLQTLADPIVKILTQSTAHLESYSQFPYWDFKQWSIGYGTACGYDHNRKPMLSVSKFEAIEEALKQYSSLMIQLQPKVNESLKYSQWAAILLFSYNIGSISKNMLFNINTNSKYLENEWKSYKYAGGKINQDLIQRRDYEWRIWTQ